MSERERDDNRYGPGVPYDEILDEDGNVVEPVDLDEVLTRDTPVKVDLPFEEAARRLVKPRDDQATNDEAEGSDDDSR